MGHCISNCKKLQYSHFGDIIFAEHRMVQLKSIEGNVHGPFWPNYVNLVVDIEKSTDTASFVIIIVQYSKSNPAVKSTNILLLKLCCAYWPFNFQ